jgi:hypothetical protein
MILPSRSGSVEQGPSNSLGMNAEPIKTPEPEAWMCIFRNTGERGLYLKKPAWASDPRVPGYDWYPLYPLTPIPGDA